MLNKEKLTLTRKMQRVNSLPENPQNAWVSSELDAASAKRISAQIQIVWKSHTMSLRLANNTKSIKRLKNVDIARKNLLNNLTVNFLPLHLYAESRNVLIWWIKTVKKFYLAVMLAVVSKENKGACRAWTMSAWRKMKLLQEVRLVMTIAQFATMKATVKVSAFK